jgi:3-isopropylmalate dehydratase small subunit
MRAARVLQGRGVPLKRSDVDTDQIIPADWLKRVERTGFDAGLFSSPGRTSASARRASTRCGRSSSTASTP